MNESADSGIASGQRAGLTMGHVKANGTSLTAMVVSSLRGSKTSTALTSCFVIFISPTPALTGRRLPPVRSEAWLELRIRRKSDE